MYLAEQRMQAQLDEDSPAHKARLVVCAFWSRLWQDCEDWSRTPDADTVDLVALTLA